MSKSDIKMQTACPNCGATFDYPVQFCDKCGTNVEKERLLNEQVKKVTPTSGRTLNNKLQGYIQVIAVIEIAIGLLALILGSIMALISPFIKDIILSSNTEHNMYSEPMFTFFSGFLLFIGILIVVIAILAIYFGYKLYKLENTGRFGTMIIASLTLLAVPFGTVYGVLSLILLNRPDTIELIRERNKYL
ncbi:MAG: hypothetical protein ACFFD1_06010 [Candidatus Thorarchaeota archaeon]